MNDYETDGIARLILVAIVVNVAWLALLLLSAGWEWLEMAMSVAAAWSAS